MDNNSLDEMFSYVKGKGVARKGSADSLGTIISRYMDGGIPTLVLDNETELDARSISSGNFVVLESGGQGRQSQAGTPQNGGRQQQHDDDDDGMTDESVIGSESSVKRSVKATNLVDLGGPMTADGIPILQPEYVSEDTITPHTNKSQSQQKQIQTTQNSMLNQSPTILLLGKAKTKKIPIDLKLEIEAFDEPLISVLVENYGDDAKKDIADYIISKIDDQMLKDAITNQLRLVYKNLGNE